MDYNSALSGPPLPPPPIAGRHPSMPHPLPHHQQQQQSSGLIHDNGNGVSGRDFPALNPDEQNPNPTPLQHLSPPGLMARKDKGGSGGSSSTGASPSHSRRAHSQPNTSPGKNNGHGSSPNGSSSGSGSGSRSKGVPQSFGYIKRQANGSGMASNMVTMDAQQHLMMNPQGQQQQQSPGNPRSTAQVSAVPRGSKIKMSPGGGSGVPGTQDLHASK